MRTEQGNPSSAARDRIFSNADLQRIAKERCDREISMRSRSYGFDPGNKEETSYRCLCCKDTAIISSEAIRRWAGDKYAPSIFHSAKVEGALGVYDSLFMGDVPFLCRRSVCDANFEESVDENGQKKIRNKFAEWAADRSFSPDDCDWVHQKEWEYLRQTTKPAQPVEVEAIAPTKKLLPSLQKSDRTIETAIAPTTATSSHSGQIKPLSEVLPSLASLGHPESFKGVLEPENEIVEAEGFRVGDRVVISDDHLDKDGRREWRKEKPPVGQSGIITRLFLNKVASSYGIKAYRASLRLDGSGGYNADVSFLRRA